MRTFKCYDCSHTWELAYGEGGRGVEQQCPACGSRNVHRADAGSGAKGGRGGSGWKGRGRGRGSGRGGRGRGFGGVFQVAENDQNREAS